MTRQVKVIYALTRQEYTSPAKNMFLVKKIIQYLIVTILLYIYLIITKSFYTDYHEYITYGAC